MNLRYSFRFRIGVAFAAFALLLSAVAVLALELACRSLERQMLDQRLRDEMAFHLKYLELYPNERLPGSDYLASFKGEEGLSAELADSVARLPNGLYSLDEFEGEPIVYVHRPDPMGKPFYFFFKTDKLLYSSGWWNRRRDLFLAAFLLIPLVAFAFGYRLAGPVVRPILELARLSGAYGPEDLPKQLPGRFYPDEVGVLADKLWALTDHARKLIHRERQFSRYASHDLRTSASVTRASAELLSTMPEAQNPKVRKVVARIQRASADMDGIIETFLWLSRDPSRLVKEPHRLEPIVHAAIERYASLLEEKEVHVRVSKRAETVVDAPEGALNIVVSNLIANAFRHTQRGNIIVELDRWRLAVIDSGEGISKKILAEVFEPAVKGENSSGVGLGLSIVRDLCETFNWQVALSSAARVGTRVEVRFLPGGE